MMKIEEMSDEQVLDVIFNAVPHYLEDIKPNGDFTREGCTAAVIKYLRYLSGIPLDDSKTEQDIQYLNALIDYFKPQIAARILTVETEYRKGQMEAAINKTTAESNIVAAFERAGFEVRAEYFKHKALVKVRLDDSGWTMFWVEYDDIDKEGYLDSLVATAIRLKNSHSKNK